MIKNYNSLDDALADMAQAEDEANARLLPVQKAIIDCKEDQYFINMRAWALQGIQVFGEAWSTQRADDTELQAYHKRIDQMTKDEKWEYEYSRKSQRDSRKRGYIFGRAYSVVEPTGELGSTHVADMWPLSKEAFEEAKAQKWSPQLDREHSPILRPELEQMVTTLAKRKGIDLNKLVEEVLAGRK